MPKIWCEAINLDLLIKIIIGYIYLIDIILLEWNSKVSAFKLEYLNMQKVFWNSYIFIIWGKFFGWVLLWPFFILSIELKFASFCSPSFTLCSSRVYQRDFGKNLMAYILDLHINTSLRIIYIYRYPILLKWATWSFLLTSSQSRRGVCHVNKSVTWPSLMTCHICVCKWSGKLMLSW